MTDDRSLERAARSWLEAGPTEAPDRAVEAALHRIRTTPQERDLRIPWRLPKMTIPVRVAAAAVIGVVAVGGALFMLGTPGQSGVGGPGPTSSPTASPTPTTSPTPTAPQALPVGAIPAGTYVMTPFAGVDSKVTVCIGQPGCIEPAADNARAESIRLTLTVPDGWMSPENAGITVQGKAFTAPDHAWLFINRGAWLRTDPCRSPVPDIPVGPTFDAFAEALAVHPILDTTAPVDVTLGGYSGKYMDLHVPSDDSGCDGYWPWEPGVYAQGPGHEWHLWILDVDGIRVVIQAIDYAATSAQRQAELRAMVESIQIEP
jgi:hypothetical protein